MVSAESLAGEGRKPPTADLEIGTPASGVETSGVGRAGNWPVNSGTMGVDNG